MRYELEWLRFFAFTFVVEALVAFPLLKTVEKSAARKILAILVANLVTHPLVFFFFARVIQHRSTMTVVAESWAVLGEAVVYALVFPQMERIKAFGVSAVANGVSFVLGSVLVHASILR